MSIIIKMHTEDRVRNLLTFDLSLHQERDRSGFPCAPVRGGIFNLSFESDRDTFFFDKMTRSSMIHNVKIVIAPVSGMGPSRVIDLYDVYCVHCHDTFRDTGSLPAVTTIQLSPGITREGRVKFERPWKVSDPFAATVAPIDVNQFNKVGQGNNQDEEKNILKFIAQLRRPDTYQGEFGFDWMRDNYKTVCENYEALKKEYTPITVHGEEYFVPWLSMFPGQENVKLKLTVDIKEDTAKADDIIRLPAKNGIQFDPSELKVSDAADKEISVTCTEPLTEDTAVNLKDKDDTVIGKINILRNANHEELQFDITPVRILRNTDKEGDAKTIEQEIDRGFGDPNKGLKEDLQVLQDCLNTRSLNQALLQCNIGTVYDIIIDEGKWLADDLIIDEGCVFKDNEVLDKFYQEFEKQHPRQAKKRGVVVFLSPLRQEKAGGEGELYDIDVKHCVIYQSNLSNASSFAHEISHVLGLTHSFKDKYDLSKENINSLNKYIKEVDQQIDYMVKNNVNKEAILERWDIYKKTYKKYREFLNVHYRNLHKFTKGSTDNFMDYHNSRKSFWKFQWKSLQDDMVKFYNN